MYILGKFGTLGYVREPTEFEVLNSVGSLFQNHDRGRWGQAQHHNVALVILPPLKSSPLVAAQRIRYEA